MPRSRDAILLAALTFVCFVNVGTMSSSLGLFIDPIRNDLGWTIGRVSQLPSAFFMGGAVASLAVGALLDRFGGRRVMVASAVMAAGAFVAASRLSDARALGVVFALAGAGSAGSTMIPMTYVASRHLRTSLSVALAFILCGATLGAAVLPVAIESILAELGWRSTMLGIAAVITCLVLPVLVGVIPRTGASSPSVPSRVDSPARTSAPIGSLSLVMLVQFLFTVAMMGLLVHMVPLLTSRGFTAGTAVMIFAGINLMALVGFPAMGWLADRFGALPVLVVASLLTAAAIPLLQWVDADRGSTAHLVAFALTWGAVSGCSAQLTPVLIDRLAPAETAGRYFGIAGFVNGVASSVGPVAAGMLADRSAGYRSVVPAAALVTFVSILPLLALRRAVPDARVTSLSEERA